jgi:hypothetical protein
LKVESGKKTKKEFYTEDHRDTEKRRGRRKKRMQRDFSLRGPTRLQEQT